ncbi:GNAT family N-acetyltransferase [Phaeovulum vinaykumarii]|uniref:Putative acetyltransferase n=1 Tax=Phaeovulum vinaykumarii TaxID=407234 RepID=A0A1N7JLR3_9RHOB|nr:N-acetyltransferase [Phaeovulum vinaykumarii]SIS50196.1 putative acetyltransferase [Phaeovulum vinaykumarii]SOB90146.1 putative acetyltransferase [Phaeovulum vinaykumarii]
MRLRAETPDDIAAIADLVGAAFAGAPHASGTEAAIVAALRDAGALALSLVAETEAGPVGHVAASAGRIEGGGGRWFVIGPLAVHPDHQRRGIGTALMRQALADLAARGASGVALVGDPGFYGRIGFRAFSGLHAPGVPDPYVLAHPFGDAAPRGVLRWHVAFGTG